jgi:Tfp pilus assembly protein PilE
MRLKRILKNSAGFSLLEALIALVITGIITTAMFKAYITQHQNYLAQDDITTIQQGARASIDELTRHIRMAGNDVPDGLPSLIAANTNPDTITITYRSDACDTYLSAAMPQPSSELKCGTDVSCYYDGQWVYILDPTDNTGEFFEITHVQTGSMHIQHNTMTLSKAYDADAILLSMNKVKFFIDNSTDPDHPNLMVEMLGMSPQVYAENISDLQFEYRLRNGTVVDVPVLAGDIREVLISVVGRSEHEAYEDDNIDFRLRTYASSVNLRNF